MGRVEIKEKLLAGMTAGAAGEEQRFLDMGARHLRGGRQRAGSNPNSE